MTRRLLTMLGFGGAAAQVKTTTECKAENAHCGSFEAKIVNPRPKPASGECPVCGTVAPKPDPRLPDEVLVRCAHCAVAFWQDQDSDVER